MASIKPVDKLILYRMMKEPLRYDGLRDGLAELPVPDKFKLWHRKVSVPETIQDFGDNICYGQRMYFTRPEPNDYGLVLRFITGYYYPVYKKRLWNEKLALEFGSFVLHCKVIDVFPVAIHFIKLMGELADREVKLLQRKPTKQEEAAGIDKLTKFSDLNAVLFLQESFKCSEEEVMQKPYNDCLVRFMLQKENNAFNDRLSEIYRKEAEIKKK
jgi:hypothetical protein